MSTTNGRTHHHTRTRQNVFAATTTTTVLAITTTTSQMTCLATTEMAATAAETMLGRDGTNYGIATSEYTTWYIPFPILTRKTRETLSLLGHIGNFLSLCFIFFYWWWFLFIFITIICSTAVVSRSPPPPGRWAWHSTPNLNRQHLASVFTYALILWISDPSLVVFN